MSGDWLEVKITILVRGNEKKKPYNREEASTDKKIFKTEKSLK